MYSLFRSRLVHWPSFCAKFLFRSWFSSANQKELFERERERFRFGEGEEWYIRWYTERERYTYRSSISVAFICPKNAVLRNDFGQVKHSSVIEITGLPLNLVFSLKALSILFCLYQKHLNQVGPLISIWEILFYIWPCDSPLVFIQVCNLLSLKSAYINDPRVRLI